MSTDAFDTHIVLTGPMGSGKTTVGRELARRLDRPFFDSDAQIEEEYGSTSRVLAETRGVGWLHRAEAEMLGVALAEETPVVVAAAASIGDLDDLDRFLGSGVTTVLLDGDVAVLAARGREGSHRRIITNDRYRALTERRYRALAPYADLTIDVTHIPPAAVVERIHRDCK